MKTNKSKIKTYLNVLRKPGGEGRPGGGVEPSGNAFRGSMFEVKVM